MLYTVTLTNFGSVVYQGPDFVAAKDAAISAGFECIFSSEEEGVFMCWSPISGFRTLF
jgi:hypothetical protein